MGLIVDTNVLVDFDRAGSGVEQIVDQIIRKFGNIQPTISVVTVVELNHGVFRTSGEIHRLRRRQFYDDTLAAFVIAPVSFAIAELAGEIDGQQAARGINIPFEDLLIGATALHHGDAVLTGNTRHLQLIPGLSVVSL